MTKQQFLWWIHQRLLVVHGDGELVDFMWALRNLVATTPPEEEMPKTITLALASYDRLRWLFDPLPSKPNLLQPEKLSNPEEGQTP